MFRRALVLATGTALSLVMGVGPAQAAKPLDHGHWEGTDSFDVEDCGVVLHIDAAFDGVTTIRVVRGSDGQAFLAHDNYEFSETITLADDDPTTNEYVTTHGKGNFVEQHATHLYGDVWRFEAIDAGTFTVRDSDGNVLLRARGVVQLTAVFDTLGDGEPGGVLISEEVVVRGPHPDTFCDVVLAELT